MVVDGCPTASSRFPSRISAVDPDLDRERSWRTPVVDCRGPQRRERGSVPRLEGVRTPPPNPLSEAERGSRKEGESYLSGSPFSPLRGEGWVGFRTVVRRAGRPVPRSGQDAVLRLANRRLRHAQLNRDIAGNLILDLHPPERLPGASSNSPRMASSVCRTWRPTRSSSEGSGSSSACSGTASRRT